MLWSDPALSIFAALTLNVKYDTLHWHSINNLHNALPDGYYFTFDLPNNPEKVAISILNFKLRKQALYSK